MAELVAEAARRAWPELPTGAPTFENILKHSVIVLRQNNQPLTKLADLLVDKDFREQLLRNVTDEQVLRFFHQRMDQWGRDEAHMKESTLNRADLLQLSPVLRYSLGSTDNRLSFRELIDSGRSLIVNLAPAVCASGGPAGARNQRCCPGSYRRRPRRCSMTRRRRTDLALLLIVRRAERDAGTPSRWRADQPDPRMAIDRECRRTDPDLSTHPDRGPAVIPNTT